MASSFPVMEAPEDLPVVDLRAVLAIGRARGDHLLCAGERVVLDRMASLEGPAARLFARLSARVPEVFEVAELSAPGVTDLPAALDELRREGLIDTLVPATHRASQLTVSRLKELCEAHRLSIRGRRADLLERVVAADVPIPGSWIRVRHRGLLQRVERWAFLRRHADRSTLVVERLGHVLWPDYTPSPGPGPHVDRRALLRWEALLHASLTPGQALEALRAGHTRAAGPLDLTRRVHRELRQHARDLERSDPALAVDLYERLAHAGHPGDPTRHARALELAGRAHDALELLRRALDGEDGPRRLAIHRSGRRLARSLRAGWAPDKPLQGPKRRTLRLPPLDAPGPRPHYAVGGQSLPIEQALVAQLEGCGRRALHGENGLWTTLFALLFAELYFLPVPGALPSRWLSGPLDLGSPAFYRARQTQADRLLEALRLGEGPDRIASADPIWRGVRLAGARWDLLASDLESVASGLGGPALAQILEILLQRGWRAARGLPDLAILPGPEVRLPHSVPERLSTGLLLAEVKGPTDSVRDAQAIWFHRLRSAGAPIALWEVRPLAPVC